MSVSILFIASIFLCPGSLDGNEHVILIGGNKYLLIASLDAEESEVVGGIQITNHAFGLLSEKGDVFSIVVAYILKADTLLLVKFEGRAHDSSTVVDN
jgi:hypothetical protein